MLKSLYPGFLDWGLTPTHTPGDGVCPKRKKFLCMNFAAMSDEGVESVQTCFSLIL